LLARLPQRLARRSRLVRRAGSPPLAQQWTPDSQRLAYVDPRSEIWVQPLDGSAPRRIARFAEDGSQILDFAWSSDGGRLAVARYATTNNIVLFRGLRRRTP
jgi:Tol biopolymer transport system component